ncbi:MAG: DUF2062 domain-containing protein [Pseudomonadota bacterium]
MIYPRGGWGRAISYVKLRVRRLPGTPESIGRGVWAGVFATFTPFFGVHFIVAAIVARVMRGNLLAALMSTFIGNPLTFFAIGYVSLRTGYWMLGLELRESTVRSFGPKFVDAWQELKHNIWAMFTDEKADWDGLAVFYEEIFYPYLIGGILPGVLTATAIYYLSVPVIRAYKMRRLARIKAKFEAIKRSADVAADAGLKPE